MSKRIEELFEQVYDGKLPTDVFSIHPCEIEKFAEMIVRELIEVGRQAFLKDNRVVPVFPAKQIKLHFGVE